MLEVLFHMKGVSGFLVALLLAAGPAGSLCGGWQRAPEARAACCTPDCDMHEAAPEPARAVTQAQADACCALSESNDTQAAASALVPPAVLVRIESPLSMGGLDHTSALGGSRIAAVLPPGPVPRHVLLSVFLV